MMSPFSLGRQDLQLRAAGSLALLPELITYQEIRSVTRMAGLFRKILGNPANFILFKKDRIAMIYLSGTYSQIDPRYKNQFGYMLNVNRATGGEKSAVKHLWMLDNGAFSSSWDYDVWLKRATNLAKYASTCIGSVVPDTVSDPIDTLDKWDTYYAIVRNLGYTPFFATQDGCTVDMIPWHEIGGLFIGGSDSHKATESWPLIHRAISMNLWVHVGRINSATKLLQYYMCNSADGTHLTFDSSLRRQRNILRGVRLCNARKTIQGKLFTVE